MNGLEMGRRESEVRGRREEREEKWSFPLLQSYIDH